MSLTKPTLPYTPNGPLECDTYVVAPTNQPNVAKLQSWQPGDIFVTHGHDFVDNMIQLVTRSHWNHCGVIVSETGETHESTEKGLTAGSLYGRSDIVFVIALDLTESERLAALAFTTDLFNRHDTYGFWSYPTLVLRALTKSRLIVELDRTDFCSEHVARTLEHAGVILPMRPALVFPADIFKWFGAP